MNLSIFRRLALVVAAIAIAAAPLLAHDLWIEPTTFSPDAGEIIGARLRIGQDLLGDPLPRDPALIQQFIVEDADGRRQLVGRPGADPAGLLRAESPGVLVIGYRSNPSAIALTADKFNQYLKEEGLDAVAALRARRGQSGPAREIFSRCAKSLVLAGSSNRTQHADRALGFTLELVAERNPYTMTAGQDLPVRLTYENRPLSGALVVAINRAKPTEKLTARSDRDGRVHFRLPRSGMWLVKAVHMIEAPTGTDADWVSYWASLTFDLPNSAASSGPAS